jgi:hypothetical protein
MAEDRVNPGLRRAVAERARGCCEYYGHRGVQSLRQLRIDGTAEVFECVQGDQKRKKKIHLFI